MRAVIAPIAVAFAAFAALFLYGCAGMQPVEGRPSGREGWLLHGVRSLHFEAPAGWRASGDERRLSMEEPGGHARIEVSISRPYADERACLAAAEAKLGEGERTFERARRHLTTFAGRPAQSFEGDGGGWHVWAIAACDSGTQYRVFFTSATPASPEALLAWQTFVRSARIVEPAAAAEGS